MKFGEIVKKIKLAKKEIILRYPKIEDLNGFRCLTNSLVEEGAFINIQTKISRKKELEWLLDQIKNIENKKGILLVVEIDGEIKGFATIEKSWGLTRQPGFHIGELEINLAKDARRIGLGDRLLLIAIREAQKRLKIKIIFIDVAKPNKIALNFYEKHGFKKVGVIRKGFKYHGKYFNDLILVKYL